MRPPSPTRVGPFRYRTEVVDMADNDADGTCQADKELIRVHTNLSALKQREVVLHEHLHAIWADRNVLAGADDKAEELVVATMAPGILQLLRDNPRLVAYLTERVS